MKRLTVENFQSHDKTVVEFAPSGQLTILIGRSRSGKTAIIRALRWLLYNSPRGVSVAGKAGRDEDEKSGYCRVGASFIRVTLEMEDGHKVTRERTAGTNRYRIVYPEGEGREPLVMEGFGDSVPLEVQEITGVRPIRIGDQEINLNLSEQLDGPFLGSKSISAPARAKVLGKLAGTEEIDYAGKVLGTDLHRRRRDKERHEADVEGLDVKIAGFDWLEGYGERIAELEGLVEEVKAAGERKQRLAAFKDDLAYLTEEVGLCQWFIDRWAGVEQAEQEVLKAQQAAERQEDARMLTSQLYQVRGAIGLAKEAIQRWQGVEAAEQEVLGAEAAEVRRERLDALKDKLWGIIDRMDYCRMVLDWRKGLEEGTQVALEAEAARDRLRMMRDYKYKLIGLDEAMCDTWGRIVELEHAEQAAELPGEIARAIARRDALARLRQLYKGCQIGCEQARQEADRLAGVDEAAAVLTEAEALRSRLAEARRLDFTLRQSGVAVKQCRQQLVVHENRVAELEGAYKDALLSLGVCPVCGNEINNDTCKNLKGVM